jgi:hypothetical protein
LGGGRGDGDGDDDSNDQGPDFDDLKISEK